MTQEIDLGGTIYISSKRAAEITGYTQDYVGQLARSGAIDAKRISGLWYVHEDSLRSYKVKADEFVPTPPPKKDPAPDLESAVSFDGKDYVSAHRAAKITGYAADYVGQLARSGKIVSRQIGNRWYVDREGIVVHKKHNDALLAAVQTDSVGLERNPEPIIETKEEPQPVFFRYSPEILKPLPELAVKAEDAPQQEETQSSEIEVPVGATEVVSSTEPVTEIPIRVIHKEQPPLVIVPRVPAKISIPGTQKIETIPSRAKTGTAIYVAIFAVVLIIGGGVAMLTGIFSGGQKNAPIAAAVPSQNLSAETDSGSPIEVLRGFFSKELVYTQKKAF